MKSSRLVSAAALLFLAFRVPMAMPQQNPFVQFNVSGSFLNYIDNQNAALSGWFIVNENNGMVLRADFFHGSIEAATLIHPVDLPPNILVLFTTNTPGDFVELALLAPNNEGSLAGYPGGVLCTGIEPGCGGTGSGFTAHYDGRDAYERNDDLGSGSVTEAGPAPLVKIAMVPHGARPVPIDPRMHGLTTVAILSTRQFDAVTDIDAGSLTFGSRGDEQSLSSCDTDGQDFNGDRLPDLICHFHTRMTGFLPSDEVGVLIGKTTQGSPFVGLQKIAVKPLGK